MKCSIKTRCSKRPITLEGQVLWQLWQASACVNKGNNRPHEGVCCFPDIWSIDVFIVIFVTLVSYYILFVNIFNIVVLFWAFFVVYVKSFPLFGLGKNIVSARKVAFEIGTWWLLWPKKMKGMKEWFVVFKTWFLEWPVFTIASPLFHSLLYAQPSEVK